MFRLVLLGWCKGMGMARGDGALLACVCGQRSRPSKAGRRIPWRPSCTACQALTTHAPSPRRPCSPGACSAARRHGGATRSCGRVAPWRAAPTRRSLMLTPSPAASRWTPATLTSRVPATATAPMARPRPLTRQPLRLLRQRRGRPAPLLAAAPSVSLGGGLSGTPRCVPGHSFAASWEAGEAKGQAGCLGGRLLLACSATVLLPGAAQALVCPTPARPALRSPRSPGPRRARSRHLAAATHRGRGVWRACGPLGELASAARLPHPPIAAPCTCAAPRCALLRRPVSAHSPAPLLLLPIPALSACPTNLSTLSALPNRLGISPCRSTTCRRRCWVWPLSCAPSSSSLCRADVSSQRGGAGTNDGESPGPGRLCTPCAALAHAGRTLVTTAAQASLSVSLALQM